MALHHQVIKHATSGQSHLIVMAVILSFIVYITLQGHLGAYLNDLGIGKKPLPSIQSSVAAAGSAGSSVANIIGGVGGGGIGSVFGGLGGGAGGSSSAGVAPGIVPGAN